MAIGSALGSLIPAALALVGLVTILRSRGKQRRGAPVGGAGDEKRRAAAAEMERRMASYLAQRDSGGQ
jgi:hypothetical protein